MHTIADFRRAAVPNSTWLCINRQYPETSGLRTITGGTTRLHFTGFHADGTITNGSLHIPRADECRIDGDTLHLLQHPDADLIVWTWTLLAPTAQWHDKYPPRYFAATPLREGLRGPAGKPWCVYDRDHDKAVNAAGQAVDDNAAYFATQTEADDLVQRLEPAGTTYYSYGHKPVEGNWTYDIDDMAITYGDGPWPFHHGERGGPTSVRLAPSTAYLSWGNEIVMVWPRRFGQAEADLHLYVRQQGSYAMVWRCTVAIDLLADTFTVPDHCPPTLREQAATKAQKILNLVTAGRRERDTYLRPLTARNRAAKTGQTRPHERDRRPKPLPEPTPPPADVQTVEQHRDVWQQVGPDEWLTAVPGDSQRPQLHRHDTTSMLRLGAVTPLPSPPLPELERIGAAMIGRTLVLPTRQPGRRLYELTVQHTEAGFLYGPTDRGYRTVVHLAASGLLTDQPGDLTDRHGRLIRVGDRIHEYTTYRFGLEPAGRLIGAFRVIGLNPDAGVLFTDRHAEHGQPEAVAFPTDVEVID
ncbi:hypothetical protein [Micromonospora sp. NPDC051141]|uniref:hypothetical protein n=1 Tax=Micromonospora sp. NPDC051141 TaxID=3364284 RepID=UPI0037BDFDC6